MDDFSDIILLNGRLARSILNHKELTSEGFPLCQLTTKMLIIALLNEIKDIYTDHQLIAAYEGFTEFLIALDESVEKAPVKQLDEMRDYLSGMREFRLLPEIMN